jgi:transmembrane sensor
MQINYFYFFSYAIGCFFFPSRINIKALTLNQDIVELLQKYVDKNCSKAQLEQVLLIIETGSYTDEFEYVLKQDADFVSSAEDHIVKQDEVSVLKLHDRLMTSINDLEKVTQSSRRTVMLKWITITVAASLLLFFSWSFFTSTNNRFNLNGDKIMYTNDIAPGKSEATLLLQNGKKITLKTAKAGVILKNGQITYNDGTKIMSSAKQSFNEQYTASTAIGTTYELTLPDGTLVLLNASSELEFPAYFEGNTRTVQLKGEAFFKVSKDKSHPFIVKSNKQEVKVLGTHFNLNSYADEKVTTTTLIEGSVQLTSNGHTAMLKPGQQSTISGEGIFAVSEVDTSFAMAWRNNKFIFEKNDIKSVMRMIQRWYNVEVIYSGELPTASFGGKISRFNNVSSILRLLEITGGVHFKIEGKKIYVFK